MEEYTIVIKSIRVKDDKAKIGFEKRYTSSLEVAKGTESVPFLIHEDFQKALDELRPHLVKLCDQKEGDVIKRKITGLHEEAFANITVTGVVISGRGEDEGVELSGERYIRGGRVLPLEAQHEKWQDEYSDYKFKAELHQAVMAVQDEAYEYLVNQKCGEGQISLDFNAHASDMED